MVLIATLPGNTLKASTPGIQNMPHDPIVWGRILDGTIAVRWNEMTHKVYVWVNEQTIGVFDERAILLHQMARSNGYSLGEFLKIAED